jgi:hypothetical protein
MAADHKIPPTPGLPHLDGRFLIEIESWEANLHVGLASSHTPREHQFQGGLAFVRGFDLKGRVVAPRVSFGKAIDIHLSTFGPELQFGDEGLDEVGQFWIHPSKPRHFSATVMAPEAALPLAATCLGTAWKYLHFWTFDEDDERASVGAFSFSSEIHENLTPWMAAD